MPNQVDRVIDDWRLVTSLQELLQPLQGSAEQTPSSTSTVSQAVQNLGETGRGEAASQDNATVSSVLNLTENLVVFLVFFQMSFLVGFNGS